jgi:hypothetical protein
VGPIGRFSPGQCVACPGGNARVGTSREAGLLVLQRGAGWAGAPGPHSWFYILGQLPLWLYILGHQLHSILDLRD